MAKKINEISKMPKINIALNGWQSPISLKVYVQSIVDGLVTNTITTITFKGTIQPLSAEQVQLKPEGQRSFQWLQIHVYKTDNILNINDRISYDDKDYKVMAIKNYKLNNYIEYHLVEDYTNA